jgi:hypothetical protein
MASFSNSLTWSFTGFPQRPEQFDERGKLIVRVQAARTGQDPDFGAFECVGLPAEGCLGTREGMPIGAQPEKGDRSRLVAADLRPQPFASGDEFRRRELVGCGRRAAHEIGQSEPMLQRQVFFGRVKEPRSEACGVQRRPEPIPRPCEVIACSGGIEAWVDAAEKYV